MSMYWSHFYVIA